MNLLTKYVSILPASKAEAQKVKYTMTGDVALLVTKQEQHATCLVAIAESQAKIADADVLVAAAKRGSSLSINLHPSSSGQSTILVIFLKASLVL